MLLANKIIGKMLFIAEFSVLLISKLELIYKRSEGSGKKKKRKLKNSSGLTGSFLCPDLGLHSPRVLLDTDCSAAQLVAYVGTYLKKLNDRQLWIYRIPGEQVLYDDAGIQTDQR